MSGFTPLDVVEMKQAMKGMAEIFRGYFVDLINQGFTEEQALRIAMAWQAGIQRGATNEDEGS